MTLSIIILNYRSWEHTESCIKSISKFLNELKYEIIVVDNDSQDNFFDFYSQKHKSVKFYKNLGNYGYSNGNNLGASFASGELLLFMNPDTELTDSRAITEMISTYKNDSSIGVLSCRKINERGKFDREITFLNPWLTVGPIRSIYKFLIRNKLKKQFDDLNDIIYPEWVTGSIFMIAKDIFEKVKGLSDEDYFMYFEEMDLAQKIRKIKKQVCLDRNISIKHKHGGSSRKNPTTSAFTKTELMISRHVYIEKFYAGVNKIMLHLFMATYEISLKSIMGTISLPFFWTIKGKTNILLLLNALNYYLKLPFNKTWKSPRILNRI